MNTGSTKPTQASYQNHRCEEQLRSETARILQAIKNLPSHRLNDLEGKIADRMASSWSDFMAQLNRLSSKDRRALLWVLVNDLDLVLVHYESAAAALRSNS